MARQGQRGAEGVWLGGYWIRSCNPNELSTVIVYEAIYRWISWISEEAEVLARPGHQDPTQCRRSTKIGQLVAPSACLGPALGLPEITSCDRAGQSSPGSSTTCSLPSGRRSAKYS